MRQSQTEEEIRQTARSVVSQAVIQAISKVYVEQLLDRIQKAARNSEARHTGAMEIRTTETESCKIRSNSEDINEEKEGNKKDRTVVVSSADAHPLCRDVPREQGKSYILHVKSRLHYNGSAKHTSKWKITVPSSNASNLNAKIKTNKVQSIVAKRRSYWRLYSRDSEKAEIQKLSNDGSHKALNKRLEPQKKAALSRNLTSTCQPKGARDIREAREQIVSTNLSPELEKTTGKNRRSNMMRRKNNKLGPAGCDLKGYSLKNKDLGQPAEQKSREIELPENSFRSIDNKNVSRNREGKSKVEKSSWQASSQNRDKKSKTKSSSKSGDCVPSSNKLDQDRVMKINLSEVNHSIGSKDNDNDEEKALTPPGMFTTGGQARWKAGSSPLGSKEKRGKARKELKDVKCVNNDWVKVPFTYDKQCNGDDADSRVDDRDELAKHTEGAIQKESGKSTLLQSFARERALLVARSSNHGTKDYLMNEDYIGCSYLALKQDTNTVRRPNSEGHKAHTKGSQTEQDKEGHRQRCKIKANTKSNSAYPAKSSKLAKENIQRAMNHHSSQPSLCYHSKSDCLDLGRYSAPAKTYHLPKTNSRGLLIERVGALTAHRLPSTVRLSGRLPHLLSTSQEGVYSEKEEFVCCNASLKNESGQTSDSEGHMSETFSEDSGYETVPSLSTCHTMPQKGKRNFTKVSANNPAANMAIIEEEKRRAPGYQILCNEKRKQSIAYDKKRRSKSLWHVQEASRRRGDEQRRKTIQLLITENGSTKF